MSERRQVWETLATLLRRLESGSSLGSNGVAEELRRLGKAQFKANTLAQDQLARLNELVAAQQAEQLETIIQERVGAARHELLEAILPALDGVENAITSGRRYLVIRDRAAAIPDPTPTQATLVSPADRAMLAGWLDGLRLLRDRLLAVLEAGGVTPIPTVGHSFDPYLHMAVGTTDQGEGPEGIIVTEERRGYRSPTGVLRYAEVIVYQVGHKEKA